MLSIPLFVIAATAHLSLAVDVFLHPRPAFLRHSLDPNEATSEVSRHLGLEAFVPLVDASYGEQPFVGEGSSNALLLTMEQTDAEAILPAGLPQAFSLETSTTNPIESLDSVVSTYLAQARHSFASLFDGFQFGSAEDADKLASFFDSADEPAFAGVDASRLADIRREYGSNSHQYALAADRLHSYLDRALRAGHVKLAVMTFDPPSILEKRQDQTQSPLPPPTALPQQPISGVSTCFASLDSCTNSTSSCSGHGQCVQASKAGRTCFVCSCSATKTGEGKNVKTTNWAGESCERQDISSQFVLFTGTALVMIILVVSSVSLLSSVGEQPLPSMLLATAVTSK